MYKMCFIYTPLCASRVSENRAKGNEWRVPHQSLYECYLIQSSDNPALPAPNSGLVRAGMHREEDKRDRTGGGMKGGDRGVMRWEGRKDKEDYAREDAGWYIKNRKECWRWGDGGSVAQKQTNRERKHPQQKNRGPKLLLAISITC